jgi:hypothetical protein
LGTGLGQGHEAMPKAAPKPRPSRDKAAGRMQKSSIIKALWRFGIKTQRGVAKAGGESE